MQVHRGKVTLTTDMLEPSPYSGLKELAECLHASPIANGYMPCWGTLCNNFKPQPDPIFDCKVTIEGRFFPMDNEDILCERDLLAGGRYPGTGKDFARAGEVRRRRSGLIASIRGLYFENGYANDVQDYMV